MVWGLFPVESLPGGQKYFFFSKGTYKVGRKDCDVIIKNDRGVSRIHAEVVVDAMASLDPLQNMSDSFLADVRIRDLSKYGTFINREKGSKAINELPNKETTLKNGDLISFGTGNAIFRFCFVPIIFFIHSLKSSRAKPSLQDIISSIGASATHKWTSTCTHVIAEETSSVTEDLIDAIVAQKPVVRGDWVKAVADKNIQTELPSWTSPTLRLEGTPVKIVEPGVRENCLAGHTFVLGSSHLYKFGDRLKSLLEMCGAKVILVDEFCSSSQTSMDKADSTLVLVVPEGSVNEFSHFRHLVSLSKANEMKLVAAVLSGHLDPSIVELPSIVVSSSHSTDETVVADSDVETDTATSGRGAVPVQSEEVIKHEVKVSEDHADVVSEKKPSSFNIEDGGTIERRNKGDELDTSGHKNSDIIFSQDLIVRDIATLTVNRSLSRKDIVNFKCFKKVDAPSGNSFKNLIPFSRDPYKESDLGNEEIAEYVREEKKRKQIEAVAEDLFNSEKVKRRGSAGLSLQGLLTRR